jgi:hypothetical protein
VTDEPAHDAPTAPQPATPSSEPASSAEPAPPGEPAAEAHPWAEPDRPRGLDAYFAPGGEDDAPPERVADERRLTRLLVLMLVLLVGVPLLLTFVAFVLQLASLASR